jgi:6-pyruvoyl-tetrahydropterin synthase
MKIRSNKVFKVQFSKKVDLPEDDEKFTHPFYNDITICLDEDDDKYIGFTDDDDMFINLSEVKVNNIANVLNKYNAEFTITDVTEKVISGEIQKSYPEVEILTPDLFKNFRIDNTEIDQILDKINNSGIESLDEVDKVILKS